MQRDAFRSQPFRRVLEDVVIEDDKGMGAFGTSSTQRLDKAELAATISHQILDQQYTLAFMDIPFNTCIAAKTLWLLAHILHRQCRALGQPGGKGNARRLTARKRIKAFKADFIHDYRLTMIHHGTSLPRKGNDLAAVNIDRAFRA